MQSSIGILEYTSVFWNMPCPCEPLAFGRDCMMKTRPPDHGRFRDVIKDVQFPKHGLVVQTATFPEFIYNCIKRNYVVFR
jgi:hypothetical protein